MTQSMNQNARIQPAVRRYRAILSSFGITQIHLRNPWVIAFWSAMFPGLGHIILSKYLRGYILFVWEILINLSSNINLAILYSFTGRFEMAKSVIDVNFVWLYIPTYFFAIWDSYRTTVDLNNQFILAVREDAEINSFSMSTVEISHLDKKSPFASLVWSALMPGTGHLYVFRIINTFFILGWWIIVVYYSKAMAAFRYSLLGDFQRSIAVLHPQWFLNIPSIYFASLYDAYVKAVEHNNLFDWEQSKFLNRNYQSGSFPMPSLRRKNRGETMYIVSTFDHSIFLERAVTEVQAKGIAKEDILAVSLDKRNEDIRFFDTLHQSDGHSLMDVPIILAAMSTLLGGIYGFILPWGPILWGIIGMAAGLMIGFAIKVLTIRKKAGRSSRGVSSEVVLMIVCEESQADMIKEILWQHNALGVRKLILGEDGT